WVRKTSRSVSCPSRFTRDCRPFTLRTTLFMCPLRAPAQNGLNGPAQQLGEQRPPILGGCADVVDRIREIEKMARGLADRRVFAMGAVQRCIGLGAPQRLRPEPACCQPGLRANSILSEGQGAADRNDRIVAVDPRELKIMSSRSCGYWRQDKSRNHLSLIQYRRQVVEEELRSRNGTPPLRTGNLDRSIRSDDGRGIIACRIAMGERTANSAEITDSGMS